MLLLRFLIQGGVGIRDFIFLPCLATLLISTIEDFLKLEDALYSKILRFYSLLGISKNFLTLIETKFEEKVPEFSKSWKTTFMIMKTVIEDDNEEIQRVISTTGMKGDRWKFNPAKMEKLKEMYKVLKVFYKATEAGRAISDCWSFGLCY